MRLLTRCAIAAVTASAALAVSTAPVAAATGPLILQGDRTTVLWHPSPGCQRTPPFSKVTNDTDSLVAVYTDTGCARFVAVVRPGSTITVASGQSVWVWS
ncbi:MAG TPA: hypothetical protein VFV66_15490 [Nonomuraea sp.]|nr:hypothetical protein [Nonomuraea sp.]